MATQLEIFVRALSRYVFFPSESLALSLLYNVLTHHGNAAYSAGYSTSLSPKFSGKILSRQA